MRTAAKNIDLSPLLDFILEHVELGGLLGELDSEKCLDFFGASQCAEYFDNDILACFDRDALLDYLKNSEK